MTLGNFTVCIDCACDGKPSCQIDASSCCPIIVGATRNEEDEAESTTEVDGLRMKRVCFLGSAMFTGKGG